MASKKQRVRWERPDLSGEKARQWRATFNQVLPQVRAAGFKGEDAEFEAYVITNAMLREAELLEPDVKAVLTHWMFDALVDEVTRPNHRALEGAIAPAGHPVWERAKLPLGWGCRCSITGITAGRARRMIEAGEGFDLTENFPEGAGLDPGFVRPK